MFWGADTGLSLKALISNFSIEISLNWNFFHISLSKNAGLSCCIWRPHALGESERAETTRKRRSKRKGDLIKYQAVRFFGDLFFYRYSMLETEPRFFLFCGCGESGEATSLWLICAQEFRSRINSTFWVQKIVYTRSLWRPRFDRGGSEFRLPPVSFFELSSSNFISAVQSRSTSSTCRHSKTLFDNFPSPMILSRVNRYFC